MLRRRQRIERGAATGGASPQRAVPGAPAVVAEGLSVERGGRQVLVDLDLQIEAGLVTGLLGPSGSGKSTLLRSLVGVQRVARGRIAVLGLPAGTPRLRSRVGYLTQAPAIYADLTVRENLEYFGRLLRAPRARVAELIDTVGLGDESGRVVGRLSGGQRARVSLASALLGAPELLVLDEPTVGLDPVLRRDLWSLFHRLAGEGTTLVVSSHVMDEAERCDRLLLLRDGRLLAAGTPDELRARTRADRLDDVFVRLIEAAR